MFIRSGSGSVAPVPDCEEKVNRQGAETAKNARLHLAALAPWRFNCFLGSPEVAVWCAYLGYFTSPDPNAGLTP